MKITPEFLAMARTNALGFPCRTDRRLCGSLLIEISSGIANGDPLNDGNNRMTPDGLAEISDKSTKRKIRDTARTYGIEQFLDHGAYRDERQRDNNNDSKAMLDRYWDLPLFGGTMTTAKPKLGPGPMQILNGFSLQPPETIERQHTCRTWGSKKEQIDAEGNTVLDGEGNAKTESRGNMTGVVDYLSYTVFRQNFCFNAMQATEYLTPDHMALFWASLFSAWEVTMSASRAGMALRRVDVYEYPNARGGVNVPNQVAWDSLVVQQHPSSRQWADHDIQQHPLPAPMVIYTWADGAVTVRTGDGKEIPMPDTGVVAVAK